MGAKLTNFLVCLVIIIGALLIFLYELYTLHMLRQIHKRFEKIKHRIYADDDDEWMDFDGNVGMSTTVTIRYDRDELEMNREKFNVAYANYVTAGQLTSLLPLLGILGTVGGLILSSGTTDLTQMVSGLGTAMWTTLWGLVSSIALKAFDAILLGRQVNLIDAKFSEADTMITRQTLQSEIHQARTRITKIQPGNAGGKQPSGVPKPAAQKQPEGGQMEAAIKRPAIEEKQAAKLPDEEVRNTAVPASKSATPPQGPTRVTKVQTKKK